MKAVIYADAGTFKGSVTITDGWVILRQPSWQQYADRDGAWEPLKSQCRFPASRVKMVQVMA